MTHDKVKIIIATAARIVSGLLMLCTLSGAFAGYISPFTWALPSLLCLVFPLLWLATLAVGLLWLVCAKEKISACLCGGVLCATLPTLLAVSPLSFPEGLREGETPLRVLTYNVAGCIDLRDHKAPYSQTVSYIIGSGADIVCLQELYSLDDAAKRGNATKAQVDSLKAMYPYSVFVGDQEEGVLSKYPVQLVEGRKSKGMNYFNYHIYKVDIKGHELALLNVHLPSYMLNKHQKSIASHLKNNPSEVLDKEQNASLYRKLTSAFEKRAKAAHQLAGIIDTIPGPLIICGDFNDVPGSYAWRTIKNTGLVDAYAEAGTGPMITFNAGYMFFHIDQVLYRPDKGIRAYGITRGHVRSSDHYPVLTDFALTLPEMKQTN